MTHRDKRAARTRGGGSGTRGNALVLAMLMMVSLTSVGLFTVQLTSSDLLVAGNLARAAQAQMAAEAGINHGLDLLAFKLNDYINAIKVAKDAGTTSEQGTGILAMSTAAPDDDAADPYLNGRPLLYVDPGGAYTERARSRQAAAYQVRTDWIYEIRGVAGFDISQDICHEAFDMRARGGLPMQDDETVETTLDPEVNQTVIVDYMARSLTGPRQCLLR